MDSLILPGAKFVMDTGTGRHSFHLDLSMVFGDCIYHSHTFSQWPIFPAASLHDVWKFNACDLVLMDPLVSLVSLIDLFGLSSVYPCCMTTFKDSSGFLRVCGGARSESRFTTVEGEFEKSIGMAACGTTALLHYRIELEIHMLVV